MLVLNTLRSDEWTSDYGTKIRSYVRNYY